ncbi:MULTISPECIES: CynX/NimT family MFS transporter [Pseudonocardia]|uniref:MFS transporter n=1 Tax=Pseudonocardia saturnea TaxID=33909 RepID=A0ABQ0RTL6_9PSEU|nr:MULTISPECIES: MFS transporter [Pseudonocardia]BBF99091.1 MFS transporter [Pseudonocardia autotrophica]GEC24011.1 MFS transporter [Pseudonocardia saturnea]
MSIADQGAPANETDATGRAASRRTGALVGTPLLVVGVALAAMNLRPAVTSMSSVLGEVRDGLGASASWTSLLTAVPTICFGLAAIIAPLLGRRLGVARAIGVAMAVLTVGLVLRVVDGPWVVLGGTFIAASGIAIGNVLIPVVVKESFPHAVGRVTGIYTAALAAGGGFGAAFTPMLEPLLGWRGAVGAWAALSAGALVVWATGARHGATPASRIADGERRSMLRRPLAWAVTAFFGLQACVAYVAMGWLSELFVSEGIPRTTAGLMLALINIIGIPLSFLIPPIALNRNSQSGWIVGLASCSLAAIVGLAVAPAAAPWLWTVLLGVGMAVFPLGLGLIALRTRETSETTDLSAMAQGFGYLLGASGPFLFGVLHGITGTWTASLALLAAVIVAEMILGWVVGRPRFV